jgi:hypothetical protein
MKRKCCLCGSTNLARRIVDEPIFDGDELVGSVRVIAYVCLQCGGSYLPLSSMRLVWKEQERLKEAKIVKAHNCKGKLILP